MQHKVETVVPGSASRPAAPVSRQEQIRAMQLQRGHEPCFRTDQRYCCNEKNCEWVSECKSLVAEWRR